MEENFGMKWKIVSMEWKKIASMDIERSSYIPFHTMPWQQNAFSCFGLINSQGAAIMFENFCCVKIFLYFFDFLRNFSSDANYSSDNADFLLSQSFSKISRNKKILCCHISTWLSVGFN